jgi:Holliday junction resolvasome RuvABC endonuclease subunit
MTSSPEQAARDELARLKGLRSGEGKVILAIDPGTSETGIALLTNGNWSWVDVIRVMGTRAELRLREMCDMVHEKVHSAIRYSDVTTVGVEWQASRPDDKRPNDIIHLAMVVGAVLAAVPERIDLKTPLPVQWKGSADGDTFTERVVKAMPEVLLQLGHVPRSLRHNGYDAAALAYWCIAKRLPWQI